MSFCLLIPCLQVQLIVPNLSSLIVNFEMQYACECAMVLGLDMTRNFSMILEIFSLKSAVLVRTIGHKFGSSFKLSFCVICTIFGTCFFCNLLNTLCYDHFIYYALLLILSLLYSLLTIPLHALFILQALHHFHPFFSLLVILCKSH